MLASTYLQAKATCDQVSALDAILDKELMLESMQQVSDKCLNYLALHTRFAFALKFAEMLIAKFTSKAFKSN